MKNLIIIPARAGSKRILNKNLVKIKKRPLLYYSLISAKKIKKKFKQSKIITLTDSKKIQSFSSKHIKNEFNYIRPKRLSGDKTKTKDTVKHLINFLIKNKKITFDFIVLLQPTSPLRNEKDIIQALKIINKNKKIQSVVSINKTLESIDDLIYKNKKKSYSPQNLIKNFKSLKEKNFFTINGNFYITRKVFFQKKQAFYNFKNETLFYEVDKKYSLDIDDSFDLDLAKKIIF